MISKIKALTTYLTTDKEKNLQAPVEMEELSDSEAINVVGGRGVSISRLFPAKYYKIQALYQLGLFTSESSPLLLHDATVIVTPIDAIAERNAHNPLPPFSFEPTNETFV